MKKLWINKYSQISSISSSDFSPAAESLQSTVSKYVPAFKQYLKSTIHAAMSSSDLDEYEHYIKKGNMIVNASAEYDLVRFWMYHEYTFPKLAKFAFDMLSIPTMIAACERAFNSGRLLIIDDRNALTPASIEAVECLRTW